MKYTDPDGKAVMAIPLIPVAIEGLKTAIITVGAILSGILLGNLATDIINDNQEESENQKAEGVKQQLESNAQATSPSPMPPDDDPNDNDPKFKNSKETAKNFNTDIKNFERNIKKDILKDSKLESENNNQLKKLLFTE